MKLPDERILYTDPSGGQILGYTKGDMHRILAEAMQMPQHVGAQLALTSHQRNVLQALLSAGSHAAAADLMGVSPHALKRAIERVKRKFPGMTTMQLVAMYARSAQ